MVVLTARFSHRACADNQSHFTRSGPIREDPEAVEVEPGHSPKQHQRRLDPDQIVQLIALYLEGQSVAQLAQEWNIHRTTVMDHLKRSDVPTRPHKRKMNDEQVTRAAEFYRAGDSLAKLSHRYNVDPQTVSRELKKTDVTIRPPGRWG